MPPKTARPSELSPEFALLGLIAEGGGHGYALHERLADELGFVWRISQSQTYATLARLDRKGDIAGHDVRQTIRPDRHLYRLTPAGRRRLTAWLFEPSACGSRAIRVEFTTRLYFVFKLHPSETTRVVDTQIEAVENGLSSLRRALADLDDARLFNRFALTLRITQLVSILDWLRDCRGTLLSTGLGERIIHP